MTNLKQRVIEHGNELALDLGYCNWHYNGGRQAIEDEASDEFIEGFNAAVELLWPAVEALKQHHYPCANLFEPGTKTVKNKPMPICSNCQTLSNIRKQLGGE